MGPVCLRMSTVLLLLASLLSLVSGECSPNDLVPGPEGTGSGCSPRDNICQISCEQGKAKCKLLNKASCTKAKVTEADLTDFAGFNNTKCLELCQLSKDEDKPNHCRFWRYDPAAGDKVCSLMHDDQCTVYEACTGHCRTGDEGCAGDEPAPSPNTPCAAPIVFDPVSIHWACFNTGNNSPYDPATTSLPAGTSCLTVQRCVDWENGTTTEQDPLWRKLHVTCDGTEGKWIATGTDGKEADYNEVLGEGTAAITEHECKGGDVTLEVPRSQLGEGADLLCDNPDTDGGDTYTITAPNTCVLLCDLHLGMTIESRLDANGEVAFHRDGAEEVFDDVSLVKCWFHRQ